MPLEKMSCGHCGKQIERDPKVVARNKSKKAFCSRSCSATYRLKNRKRKKRRGKRSRIEMYVKKVVENDCEFEVLNNVRDVLPSGLELDIYVPELQLAIEVNGPTHYKPIYGKATLKSTRARDNRKAQECIDLGIQLIIIDASKKHYSMRTAKKDVLAQYKSLVYPLLQPTNSTP